MSQRLPTATIQRSRQLRRDMTDAEHKIWRLLRENFKAWHFRRQVPIGPYFADFASHRAKLVIEIDGGQHSVERDTIRTAILEEHGFRIIRFWNDEAQGNSEGVYLSILTALQPNHPTPGPSPSRGGE